MVKFHEIFCRRYFIDEHAMIEHFRTKGHKRRLDILVFMKNFFDLSIFINLKNESTGD